ncbi:MAG: site-specific DNA-methyltransferase [Halanaerobiales bacterium]|nr:site-specific DNA-methyltransferase [Halanaerobiales bacterium]
MKRRFPEDFTNRIICDNCIKVMREIPDNSIDLIISSPPYYAYKNYTDLKSDLENQESYEDYILLMKIIFKEMFKVLSEDGRLCVIIDDKHTNLKTEGVNINRATHARFILMGEKAGFEYKDLVIWAKARAGHASGGAKYMLGSFPNPPNIPFVNWFEYILIFRKPGVSRVKYVSEERKESSKLGKEEFKWASRSIWDDIPAERNRKHPAPFPVEIPYRLIKLFSFVDDIVLDPFVGSGTTCLVAKQLNRKYIGIDISEKYCKMSKGKLSQTILEGIK